MKKTILFFACLSISLCSFSQSGKSFRMDSTVQMQKTFMGTLQLGKETDLQSIANAFKVSQYSVKETKLDNEHSAYLILGDIYFATRLWDCVIIHTYAKKFYKIRFIRYSETNIYDMYYDLLTSIYNKYADKEHSKGIEAPKHADLAYEDIGIKSNYVIGRVQKQQQSIFCKIETTYSNGLYEVELMYYDYIIDIVSVLSSDNDL